MCFRGRVKEEETPFPVCEFSPSPSTSVTRTETFSSTCRIFETGRATRRRRFPRAQTLFHAISRQIPGAEESVISKPLSEATENVSIATRARHNETQDNVAGAPSRSLARDEHRRRQLEDAHNTASSLFPSIADSRASESLGTRKPRAISRSRCASPKKGNPVCQDENLYFPPYSRPLQGSTRRLAHMSRRSRKASRICSTMRQAGDLKRPGEGEARFGTNEGLKGTSCPRMETSLYLNAKNDLFT